MYAVLVVTDVVAEGGMIASSLEYAFHSASSLSLPVVLISVLAHAK